MLCSQADVERILQVDFTADPDPTVAAYIDWADAYLKRWLNRNIEQADHADLQLKAHGTTLVLPDYPVTELTVVEDGTTLEVGTDYTVRGGGVVVRLNRYGQARHWDQRYGKIVVSCQVGYATVPDDLRLACAHLAADLFRQGVRSEGAAGPIKSETLDGHSVTYDTAVAQHTFTTSKAMPLAGPHRRSIDGPTVLDLSNPTAYTP